MIKAIHASYSVGDIFREADNLVAQSDFHHYSIKVHVACFVFLSSTLWTLKSAHI